MSNDAALRRDLRLAVESAGRASGEPWQHLETANGLDGLRAAWRELPDVVVVDEILSGAGAFAVAKDLRGAAQPFPGVIVIVLARQLDEWLARWSGADAWVSRPVDPFALADTVVSLLGLKVAEGAS